MKPKFSIVLIARNESKTLPRLIGSLKEFQERRGEILVLDTGSTDNTADVALGLGCVVHEVGDKFKINIDTELADAINTKFIVDNEPSVVKAGDSLFDFASARNYIADFATTDMIATPDCDEIWTKLDLDKIDKHIEDGAEQFEYQFVFSHDELGNPVIKFMHSKFYNRKKLKWVGVIHEVLSGDAKRIYLDESIAKLEHYQNVETNRSGYLKGLAVDCFKNPENDRNSHYFAREMMYLGRYKSAIKEFENHIAMNRWDQENAQSMLYVGDCYERMGDIEEAFKWWSKVIDKCPNKREPLMRFAEYYHKQNKALQTIIYAEAALTIPQAPFYSNYQPYYEHLPHELLYWAYWYTGNKEKSKEHFDKAFAFAPTNPKYISEKKFYYSSSPTISFIIPSLGRPDGLKRCLDSIDKLNYPKDLMDIKIVEGEDTVPVKVKIGVDNTHGEYIVYAANDMEFDPECINEALKIDKGLVSFNEGMLLPDNGNICTHFMIKRSLIDKIGGEIFDTEFTHTGCDNLLWAKCEKLGEASYCEGAKITHNHFSKGGEYDDVYKKGWLNVEKDRELLKAKLKQL